MEPRESRTLTVKIGWTPPREVGERREVRRSFDRGIGFTFGLVTRLRGTYFITGWWR